MHVATTPSRNHRFAPARQSAGAPARIESLEGRVLMSAAWTTVEDIPFGYADRLATDPAGNVYVGGVQVDISGRELNVIRMKASGSSEWTTIYSGNRNPYAIAQEMAVNAAGDIYELGLNGTVLQLKRSAGATTFSVVDQPPALVANKVTHYPQIHDVTVGPEGTVYVTGLTPFLGPRNSIVRKWTVRKQTGGQGPFVTVDAYENPNRVYPEAISVIPSGPAAGVYVVGHTYAAAPDHWLVRRSTDGGNTWSLADDFQLDPADNGSAGARGVAGDALGNVYVVGHAWTREVTGGTKRNPTYTSTPHWVTRKGVSGVGGSLSWSQSETLAQSEASDVAVDTAGNVFVLGSASVPDSGGVISRRTVVRSIVDGRWETVDDMQDDDVWGIAADASGNVFTAGMTSDTAGTLHWVVRTNTAATTAVAAAPAPTSLHVDSMPTFSTVSISGGTTQRDPALDLASGTGDMLA